MATKALSILTVVLIGLSNLGFSWYSNATRITPERVCSTLQSKGFTANCREGAPWALEVLKFDSQWRFYPTKPELFGCYKVSDEGRLVQCKFEGTVTQFASAKDMNSAVDHLNQVNHVVNQDPKADFVGSDTTFEQYTVYKFTNLRILIVIPRTEDGIQVQKTIEGLYGPSDDD